MPAPKGNKYWQLRAKHGRDKLFETPDELWQEAINYFDWANANPWRKYEAVKAGDHFGENVSSPVERPLSYEGFCLYAGISTQTWYNYLNKESDYKDFIDVALKIKTTIDNQQFEGAMVGAFNPQVTMRKLGMVDKQQTDLTSGGEKITAININIKKPDGS